MRCWGLLVLIAFCPYAHAEQCGANGVELKSPALCAKIFEFNGTCGEPKYKFPDWDNVVIAVGAWEDVPIRITGASADVIVQGKGNAPVAAIIFAGNSFNADPLTPEQYAFGISGTVVHAQKDLAPGMQFPAGMPWETTHLDVHLTCFPKGAAYSGNVSVWYRLDASPAPPASAKAQ
jgi:hypothetical protein